MIRHESTAEQAMQINQILRGHYAYYGIRGNLRSLQRLYRIAERYWHKMLCSRSPKSYVPWEKFQQMKRRSSLRTGNFDFSGARPSFTPVFFHPPCSSSIGANLCASATVNATRDPIRSVKR